MMINVRSLAIILRFCFARRHPVGNAIYWSPPLPDDVEAMIAALLSDENRSVNAQRIEVSGGLAL
jgi:hypothetical protein